MGLPGDEIHGGDGVVGVLIYGCRYEAQQTISWQRDDKLAHFQYPSFRFDQICRRTLAHADGLER